MAQHDYDVLNGSGATVRADINAALGAIATNNSGASAPSVTFANQWWYDTTNGQLKVRNPANSAWIVVANISGSTFTMASSANSATGTFNATLTFVTPGNLSVTYTKQAGFWARVGRHCTVIIQIVAATWTHTTASGSLIIGTGGSIPASTATTDIIASGGCEITNITYTGMQITPRIGVSASSINLIGSTSGGAVTVIGASNFTSGSLPSIILTISYITDVA